MSRKIGMISLGCAKNQVDAEIMLGDAAARGDIITDKPEEAEVIVVNTCAFIESAKEEAIQTILEMAEYKKNGSCQCLLVTGCLAQRYAEEIRQDLPEVDGVLGVDNYGRFCEMVDSFFADRAKSGGASSAEYAAWVERSGDLSYLNHSRILSTTPGTAYLKIAEGCDNRCAYCAIPSIRGSFRSRRREDILAEAARLAREGVKELILIAQDTTRYGLDLYGKPCLADLLCQLDQVEGIVWIRVLYLYPDEITEGLLDTFRTCRKVLPYIDLPIQHISDSVLQAMNRRGSGRTIRALFRRFRELLPDAILRTSLIVGFPGETEEDFQQLKEFVQEIQFDRMGIFSYSKEDGTRAARLKPQCRKSVKELRRRELMEQQQLISLARGQARVGKVYQTLVEGVAEDGIFYVGRTYAESPEVDGRVYFTSAEPVELGSMVPVRILIAEEYDLTGECVNEFAE